MNTFDVNKRQILSYEQFLKDRKKAEDAKHDEKGEHALVKKSMDGKVEGKKGYATLSESSQSDFFMNYSKEIKDAVEKMDKIKVAYNDFEIEEKDYPTIEKALQNYDDNVPEVLDRWAYKGVDADEIAEFALNNQDRKGTEPQFVLFAIDDYYDVLKKIGFKLA